jgi:hypothetical protein
LSGTGGPQRAQRLLHGDEQVGTRERQPGLGVSKRLRPGGQISLVDGLRQ